jgi:hypothetical protein
MKLNFRPKVMMVLKKYILVNLDGESDEIIEKLACAENTTTNTC